MPKKIRIGLAWHNLSSSNYGVAALAASHIVMVLNAASHANVDVDIETIGGAGTGGTTARDEIEAMVGRPILHNFFSLKELLRRALRLDFSSVRSFKRYDLILDIDEGDSFADIYGPRRFYNHLSSKILCILAGVPLILAPQTVGPFNGLISRTLASAVLKKARRVYTRDDKSTAYVKSLGVAAEETTDVAFSLPFDRRQVESNSVGINVSGLLFSGGYTKKNQFGLAFDYRAFCLALVEGFRSREQIVHLVGHVITEQDPVEDDYRACQSLKALFADDDGVVLAPRFSSPIEAKSYISGLAFFTGSRMHATIAAFSAGVPTIPVAYSRKFEGVFGALGYRSTIDARVSNHERAVSVLFNTFDYGLVELKQSQDSALVLAKSRNQAYVTSLTNELRCLGL